MSRPRKARVEGAKAISDADIRGIAIQGSAEELVRATDHNRALGIGAKPVESVVRDHDDNEVKFDEPKHLAHDFNAAVAYFKECFPEDWEELKLCPLQHGVETIAHKLAGKG